jgi:hypothetical protein
VSIDTKRHEKMSSFLEVELAISFSSSSVRAPKRKFDEGKGLEDFYNSEYAKGLWFEYHFIW